MSIQAGTLDPYVIRKANAEISRNLKIAVGAGNPHAKLEALCTAEAHAKYLATGAAEDPQFHYRLGRILGDVVKEGFFVIDKKGVFTNIHHMMASYTEAVRLTEMKKNDDVLKRHYLDQGSAQEKSVIVIHDCARAGFATGLYRLFEWQANFGNEKEASQAFLTAAMYANELLVAGEPLLTLRAKKKVAAIFEYLFEGKGHAALCPRGVSAVRQAYGPTYSHIVPPDHQTIPLDRAKVN